MSEMERIGVEQVVVGNDKFNQDMAKYESALNHASKTTDKFADSVSDDAKRADQAMRQARGGTDTLGTGLSLLKNLAGAGILYEVTGAVKQFAVESVKAASDFGEIESKFEVVFKETAPYARAELEKFADSINRSSSNMLGFASTIQDTLVPLGFARDRAAELSVQAVQLATDLGSFNNIDPANVINDLQSAMVGNGEVMKKYGVILNVATTEQELLNMGVMGGYKAATEQEKALARLNVVIKGTSDAQGDAARTMDSNANMTLAMKDAIFELQLAIGDALIPTTNIFINVVTEGAKRLTNLINISQQMKGAFAEQEQGAFSTAKTYDEYAKAVLDARVRTGEMGTYQRDLIMQDIQLGIVAKEVMQAYGLQSIAAFKLSKNTEETAEQHRRLQNVYQELPPLIEDTTISIEDQAAANLLAQETSTLLKDALDVGAISQLEYETMTLRAKDGTLELSDAQIAEMESAISAKEVNDQLTAAFDAQRTAAGNAALAYVGLVESYSQDEVDVFAIAVSNLEAAIKATGDPTGALTAELLEMKTATGEATEEGTLLADQADKLGRYIESGVIPVENQTEALSAWQGIVDTGKGSVQDIITEFGNFSGVTEQQIRDLEAGGEAWKTFKDDTVVPAGNALMEIGGEEGVAVTTAIAMKSLAETIESEDVSGKITTFAEETLSLVMGGFKSIFEQAGLAAGAIKKVQKALEDIDGMSATVYVNIEGEIPSTDGGQNITNTVTSADTSSECFVADTPVDTPYGAMMIQDIKSGDYVYAWDNGMVLTRVVNVGSAMRDDTVKVTTNKAVFHCSPNHRFLTDTGWVEARDLLGCNVITADGMVEVGDVSRVPGVYEVFNLHVEHKSHTYLVDGHVVHNKKFASGADFIVPAQYINDSFPLVDYVEGGERVTVTPKSEMIRQASLGSVTNKGGNTYNINVNANGLSEAQAVRVVKSTIRDLEMQA